MKRYATAWPMRAWEVAILIALAASLPIQGVIAGFSGDGLFAASASEPRVRILTRVSDLDDDGLPDVVYLLSDGVTVKVTARDGGTGATFWTKSLFQSSNALSHFTVIELDDVDHDGISDLWVAAEAESLEEGTGGLSTVRYRTGNGLVLTGEEGAVLWSIQPDTTQHTDLGTRAMAFSDADGDGGADIVITRIERVESVLDFTSRSNVTIRGGIDGHEIRRASGVIAGSHEGFYVSTPDITADASRDLLVAELRGAASVLAAYDGIDGRGLWRRLLSDYDYGEISEVESAPDLSRDGVADLTLLESGAITPGASRIHAIDGLTGADLWIRTSEISQTMRFVGDVTGDLVRDLVVLESDVFFQWVSMTLVDGASGATISQRSLHNLRPIFPLAGDLDGDASPDIILSSGSTLELASSRIGLPTVWTRASNGFVCGGDADLDGDGLPDGVEFTPSVIAGDAVIVRGLGGATGIPLWSTELDNVAYGELCQGLADLDGDGDSDVLLFIGSSTGNPSERQVLLDGPSGEILYSALIE